MYVSFCLRTSLWFFVGQGPTATGLKCKNIYGFILYLLEIAGDATRTTVSAGNWDTTQHIQKPEYIHQTIDKIRFIDGRSCAREIDRSTGTITTVIG